MKTIEKVILILGATSPTSKIYIYHNNSSYRTAELAPMQRPYSVKGKPSDKGLVVCRMFAPIEPAP